MELEEVRDYFKSLKKKQCIYIKSEKQELLGRLHHVDPYFNFIYLDVVKDVKSNVEYTSRQMIPAAMIKLIRSLENVNDSSSSSTTSQNSEISPDAVASVSCNVNLNQFEIKLLQDRIDNPIMITQSGSDYAKALNDIKSQQFVALYVEPARYGRNFKTSVITVATVQSVYIFDLITLGKLFIDFKNVLESEIPRKAIHDCHRVADHFLYQHNVRLNGVFDTFVAYSIVTKQKRSIDFLDICEQFFNIDKQVFTTVIDDPFYPHNTFQRPIEQKLIKECAKRACFILKLQEHLQHRLLDTFYSQCLNYSQTFTEHEDHSLATEKMQLDKTAGFDSIAGLDPLDQTL